MKRNNFDNLTVKEIFTEIEIFKKGYFGVKSLFENYDLNNESGIILENVVNGIPGNERIT